VKRLPRWAWVSLLVLAAMVAVILLLPFFLDVDRFRPQIVSILEKETGRRVQIGKIRARFFPSVGLVVEEVRIGHPAAFAEGDFLSADAVRANLAWGPLFRRELQFSSIEILHPRLALLEDDRGRTSYDFSTPKKAAKAPVGSGFRLGDIDYIALDDLELIFGRVAGTRRQVVPSVRAWKIRGRLSDVALDTKRLRQWRAESDLSGIRVEARGLKGPIEFRSGEFHLRDGAIESKFEADLARAARVKGAFRVANVEKAVAEFDLSAPVLDLDQILGEGVAGESAGRASAPAPQPRKSELLARGRLNVERLRWAPYEASSARAEVRIFTDRVEFWPAGASVAGGSLGVSARIDRRQTPERFSANIEVRNLDVGKLLSASPETRGKLSGTGELTVQLFGSFGPAFANALIGSGSLSIRDGKLPGFNLGGTMQSLAKLQHVLNLGGGAGVPSGETPFRSITADLQFAGARVASERIHLDSPSGTVDLKGSFGFDRTLNYDGQAVLTPGAEGGGQTAVDAVAGVLGGVMKQRIERASIPFAVRGTFSDPKIQPGRGIPSFRTSPQAERTEEQTEKKKSLLDFLRRP